MKFKLFKDEYYDRQREKHKAYLADGFTLLEQIQEKDGTVLRTYGKMLKTPNEIRKTEFWGMGVI